MNPLLENPLIVRLGWTLLHFAWQGAAVAAVFAVVNALTRSLPPHRRYVIAYFALIASGACPIVTFAMLRAPALPSPAAGISPAIQAAPSENFAGAPRHTANLRTSAPNHLQEADGLDSATDPANTVSVAGTWQPILVAAWFFGVLALSLRHAGAWFMLRRTRREARPIEDDVLLQMLSTLKERLRLNRAVELLESGCLHAPATIGFLKPAILIPTSALMGLERWQLEAVIAHELAHIRRWDFAANLLQCAIETALFYHPAVWWISRVVRQEREFCADDTALATCGDRKGYALALTRLAELSAPLELAVAATGGNLLTRIQRIVGRPEPQRSGAVSVSAALVVAGALVIALLVPRVMADDARVIEVKPGESIQSALDAAPEGATVRVAAGEFRERVNVAKRLTLEGAGWEKTRIVMPAEDAAKRKEFEDRIQAVQNPDEREALIEQSRKALDGPVLLVADARDVVIRGIRVASNGKEDSRGTVPLAEIRSAQVRLNHCAFTGPAQNGIQIGNGAEVEMAECLVAGLWGEGIIINGARGADPRVIIRDSEIRNIYHYGIQIGRGCDRVRIQRCRISGTAWHGIRYDSASPFIEGNTIYDHARSGIYASGRTRATVRGNLFLRNEMSGVSCWFDNQDLIEGNTFAANKREALAVLGASKPKVRGNIFWQNPTAVSEGKINNDAKDAKGAALLENNVFWKNEKNRPDGEKDELSPDSKSLLAEPGFANVEKNDFGLTADSAAKKAGAGVVQPLALTSPWPVLPEEKLLIPDGPSRDSNAWKKADGQTQPAANTQQRLVTLHKSVAPVIKDALQIDDAEKRSAAVEKIRSKIQSKSDEEAAAGLVAFQGIGPVKFDKKSFREALLSKLASEDSFVRSKAVSSLSGGAGERSDLERILKLAKDDDTEVRNAVGWALIWLTQKDLSGPEGDRWVEILETGNAGFRKGMIHGLWGVKTQTALQEKLVAMSKEPGELAYDCLYYALSTSPNKGEACIGRLIEYLSDADSTNIAGRAAWGLGYGVVPQQESKVADAMIKLYSAREDGYLRKNALTSLSNYAHEQHVPQLEAIIGKPGISDDDKKRLTEIIEAAKGRK